jgi:hypothetical protein
MSVYMQFLNQSSRRRLECPLCSHPLPSRNFGDYKPNYGMIEVLQQLESSTALPAAISPQPAAPTTPSPRSHPSPMPENTYIPGLSDVLPSVRAGSSNGTPAAATCELEVLPSAGSDALAHLWSRVVARYWINAQEVLGPRDLWEPWGVDSDGNVVYSGVVPHVSHMVGSSSPSFVFASGIP